MSGVFSLGATLLSPRTPFLNPSTRGLAVLRRLGAEFFLSFPSHLIFFSKRAVTSRFLRIGGFMSTSKKVTLGSLFMTPGVEGNVPHSDIISALCRHRDGDWGDVDAQDKRANDQALKHGSRLLSSYRSIDGVKFWIITEADRSSTTVLLPEEY